MLDKIAFRLYSIYRALFGLTMVLTGLWYLFSTYGYGGYFLFIGIIEILVSALYFYNEKSNFKYVDDNFDNSITRICHIIVSTVFCISPEYIYICNTPLTCLILVEMLVTICYLMIITGAYIGFLFGSIYWMIDGYLYFGIIIALLFVIQISIEFTNGMIASLYLIKDSCRTNV